MKSARRSCVFLFLLLIFMTGKNVTAQNQRMNWGVRLGLNAVSITSYEAFNVDQILENSSYTNKNGFLITGFARFNMNRMFLQPELGWSNYRRSCLFSIPVEESNTSSLPVNLNIDSKVVKSIFLAGYNIVHDYPFLLGFFAGSSLSGIYHTGYSMESDNSFSEKDLSFNYSGIIGFSINISRIYFDLRYEMGFPNANLNMRDIPGFPEYYHNVRIKKREEILSFSFGVMF